jgi:hypothetical protein
MGTPYSLHVIDAPAARRLPLLPHHGNGAAMPVFPGRRRTGSKTGNAALRPDWSR